MTDYDAFITRDNAKIEVGMVVYLASGSPGLTVTYFDINRTTNVRALVAVSWIDEEGRPQRETYPERCLSWRKP